MIWHCLVSIEYYFAFPVKKLEGCYADMGIAVSVCQYLIFLLTALIKRGALCESGSFNILCGLVLSHRYIEAMVHCASSRHPAAIVDDLHCKVLRDAVQNSKTSFSENVRKGTRKLSKALKEYWFLYFTQRKI